MEKTDIENLITKMIYYYSGDPKQIQHFLKVHSFALRIGLAEKIESSVLGTLEAAAVVHDIGIKVSREKYNSSDGKYQEIEGPALAKDMLDELAFPPEITDRVCYLVGHHHTYDNILGIDYQILIEADFLVNMYESNMTKETIISVKNDIFKTKTGLSLCEVIFSL